MEDITYRVIFNRLHGNQPPRNNPPQAPDSNGPALPVPAPAAIVNGPALPVPALAPAVVVNGPALPAPFPLATGAVEELQRQIEAF